PTDTIAAILGTYPFSIGLFRELIQNSDDAKASKQIFVLDSRKHSTRTLYHDKLAGTQGPSLLAYNDALFTQEDWEALQTIHRSSKKTDNTKIGKYGIGFRSCYHITDHPQILSGTSLAILDPHHHFSDSGGTKLNFVKLGDSCADHLSCFDFFLPSSTTPTAFSGSVIRLPLRTLQSESSISNKVVTSEEIRTLFHDFIE
ncbi:histidine kinase-like ATPase, partial [Armillaria luteobubalina]